MVRGISYSSLKIVLQIWIYQRKILKQFLLILMNKLGANESSDFSDLILFGIDIQALCSSVKFQEYQWLNNILKK